MVCRDAMELYDTYLGKYEAAKLDASNRYP
jgi:hypothetical protein